MEHGVGARLQRQCKEFSCHDVSEELASVAQKECCHAPVTSSEKHSAETQHPDKEHQGVTWCASDRSKAEVFHFQLQRVGCVACSGHSFGDRSKNAVFGGPKSHFSILEVKSRGLFEIQIARDFAAIRWKVWPPELKTLSSL